MELNTDWKELLNLFESYGVEYMVIGAFAVAYYGQPRMTGDLDLWVRPERENAARIVKCLADFGFASLGLSEEDFLEPSNVIQLGFPPRRIDLLTGINGVTFEDAWPNRQPGPINGSLVNYIGREDLIANKRSTGRAKDLFDLENLEGR